VFFEKVNINVQRTNEFMGCLSYKLSIGRLRSRVVLNYFFLLSAVFVLSRQSIKWLSIKFSSPR